MGYKRDTISPQSSRRFANGPRRLVRKSHPFPLPLCPKVPATIHTQIVQRTPPPALVLCCYSLTASFSLSLHLQRDSLCTLSRIHHCRSVHFSCFSSSRTHPHTLSYFATRWAWWRWCACVSRSLICRLVFAVTGSFFCWWCK